ncbi:MAG: hypothetical protein WBX11_01405 [Thiobacillaceae bacterium]
MDTPLQSRNESFETDVQDQQDRPGAITTPLRDELHSDVETGSMVFGLPMDDWMEARHELAMSPLLGHALMLSQSIGPSELLASERKVLADALAYNEAGDLTPRGCNVLLVQQHLLELERQQLPEHYQDLYPDLRVEHRDAQQLALEREQEAKALRTRNVGEALEAEDQARVKNKAAEHRVGDAVLLHTLVPDVAVLAEHSRHQQNLDAPSLPVFR